MLTNNRQIKISSAGSRKATQWPAQTLFWSELVSKLQTPVRSTETLAEYLKLPKSRQDDLKDVGGFVAGILQNNRRKAGNVIGRDVITLDLDNIQPGQTQNILLKIEALGCGYCVYSTRKHEEAKPRLRVLFPLNRTATADEYEPLARKLASFIGIELCDPTTFQAHRLMYWPSCCSDSIYVYKYGDKPFLDVDGLLSKYSDWRNISEWPEVPGSQHLYVKPGTKQTDPLEKVGVIGAFCRTYDVYRAIETFLPGVYTSCDDMQGRYTYTGGSTVGGAVIYDNGNFIFSHHATDPAGGKLCNAFDLVRIHRFHELDSEVKPDTPINKLPSYAAMCQLAINDTQVSTLLAQERYEKATQDFSATPASGDLNWLAHLEKSNSTGAIAKTVNNILIILENDPCLKGKIAYDEFLEKAVIGNDLPWQPSPRARNEYWRAWDDADESGLINYLESRFGISSREKISHALNLIWRKNTINELKDYLTALEWDRMPRLDTLLIDYYGAEDVPYTRAVTRKTLVAAIERVMIPGCKFDYMLILEGPQGIGKSKLLALLALKPKYYLDELRTFEGKEAAELIRGKWIAEVAELSAFNRSESNAIKGFITRLTDTYRPSYGHNTKDYPRRCIFIGTTNSDEYLKDPTGERRYWPVKLNPEKASKPREELSGILNQLWAEAFTRWQLGESLYLNPELEAFAEQIRTGRKVRDDRQGIIEEFLKKPLPLDWDKRALDERRLYWCSEFGRAEVETRERETVCVAEITAELFMQAPGNYKRSESLAISNILKALGWEPSNYPLYIPVYGSQRVYRKMKNGN